MSTKNDRYKQLLERDGTDVEDLERMALFYILSGNDDLYEKVEHIYDFEDKTIKVECLEGGVDFSTSSRKLVELAYNLYNGYGADVFGTFAVLDEDNSKLVMEAIQLRFGIK